MTRFWRWLFVGALAVAVPITTGRWWLLRHREHSQDGSIWLAACRYGVDPALLKAVMWRESRFNPRARGSAGEIGLMQVMDTAAQEWAEAEHCYPVAPAGLYDARTNTLAGAWYLRKMLRRYQATDDPVLYALADYNAGRANVLKWTRGAAATNSTAFLLQIGFPGTRDYVVSIRRRVAHYARDFPSLPTPASPPRR